MVCDILKLRRFVETSANVIEGHGLPPMAGRVIGALMVCTPPYLSHDEMAARLGASKGSISMTTQLLVQLGLVERMSLPGKRPHYYRLREALWSDLLTTGREQVQKHLEMVEEGLALLEGEPVEAKMRLIELQIFADFLLEMLPEMADRWEHRRFELLKTRLAEAS